MNKIHTLKTWPQYYKAIIDGVKTFQLRKDDRNFSVGDVLVLQEFDPDKNQYTGEMISVDVIYKVDGGKFGL
jgi:hypothetical protein